MIDSLRELMIDHHAPQPCGEGQGGGREGGAKGKVEEKVEEKDKGWVRRAGGEGECHIAISL